MRAGRIFYQGSTHEIVSHFSSLGFTCPENFNPSDFIMKMAHTLSIEECESRGLFMDKPLDNGKNGCEEDSGDKGFTTIMELKGDVCVSAATTGEGSDFFRQLVTLTHRELQNTVRDVPALIGRFGVTIFLNLLLGLVFLDVGNQDDSNRSNFNSHFGAISFVTIGSMFLTATPVLLAFPFERPMVRR